MRGRVAVWESSLERFSARLQGVGNQAPDNSLKNRNLPSGCAYGRTLPIQAARCVLSWQS
jgi:hypothetical protein